MAENGGRNNKNESGGINISRNNNISNDIYSDSKKERASFSQSSGGDIYIGKSKKNQTSSGRDVYISSRNARKFDTEELIVDIDSGYKKQTPPQGEAKETVYNFEDVSDYDGRRKTKKKSKGKRVALSIIAVILVLAIGISVWGAASVLGLSINSPPPMK